MQRTGSVHPQNSNQTAEMGERRYIGRTFLLMTDREDLLAKRVANLRAGAPLVTLDVLATLRDAKRTEKGRASVTNMGERRTDSGKRGEM